MFILIEYKRIYRYCHHILMSALPMTQLWHVGSSIFMWPTGSLHLGEANQSPLEMEPNWCLQVGLLG